MTPEDWRAVIARITTLAPIDLDDATTNPTLAFSETGDDLPLPSAALWLQVQQGAVVGVRVDAPLADTAAVALQLAAAALERGVMPVILSSLNRSGFERFGFRVERILAADAKGQDRQRAELARFWSMAVVIDAAEVLAFS